MNYKIFVNKLIWKLNPFKKEIILPLDTSHAEKVAERLYSIYPNAYKIKKSKFEIQPLEWYFDAENIPNQNMIHDVFDYFESGPRKGFLDPLQAIGMFHILWTYFTQSSKFALNWIHLLKLIDFSEEEKHVLIGIVLFWHGGYPTRNRFTGQHLSALRTIEKEFLKYDGDTPEKEFCKTKLIQKDGRWFEEKKTLDCEVTELIEVQVSPINTEVEPIEPDSKNKEFTTARQSLFMYYMFLELGVYASTDKTKLAEVTCFLTGKKQGFGLSKNKGAVR